jgi:hypothetical protein
VLGIVVVEADEVDSRPLVGVAAELPAGPPEAGPLPVDDAAAEREPRPGREPLPDDPGLVTEGELPALLDEENVELFSIVIGEIEPAPVDDPRGEGFNVLDPEELVLAVEERHATALNCACRGGVLRVAEHLDVSNVNAENRERLVTVAARVPPDLAEAVAVLAEAGDRTVSREVRKAIRTHVQRSTVGSDSSAGVGTAVGSDSSVDAPAERDGTSSRREAVEPAQLAGAE